MSELSQIIQRTQSANAPRAEAVALLRSLGESAPSIGLTSTDFYEAIGQMPGSAGLLGQVMAKTTSVIGDLGALTIVGLGYFQAGQSAVAVGNWASEKWTTFSKTFSMLRNATSPLGIGSAMLNSAKNTFFRDEQVARDEIHQDAVAGEAFQLSLTMLNAAMPPMFTLMSKSLASLGGGGGGSSTVPANAEQLAEKPSEGLLESVWNKFFGATKKDSVIADNMSRGTLASIPLTVFNAAVDLGVNPDDLRAAIARRAGN